jgi:predicted membrane protein
MINFLTYFFSNKFLKRPIRFLEKYSHISYLRLDYRYLISKSFEIFFQQILIVSLVFMLKNNGFDLFWTTIVFAFLFGFGHIPMIRLEKSFFGIFVFIAAIISSFLFPFLILSFQYGFIYTYIAHWLFYTNSGVLYWIANSEYFEKSVSKVSEKGKEVIESVREDVNNP